MDSKSISREGVGVQVPASAPAAAADELARALLPALLHRLNNVTQVLAGVNSLVRVTGSPAVLLERAGDLEHAGGALERLGWLVGALARGMGTGIGAPREDERRVLELTTVELVELRFLDGKLEQRLDEAYGLLAGSRGVVFGLSPRAREVERLARFQADSAILHENFDNALKFLGDDYLARLYELCSDRFHFAAWDLAIERKLATLESIYSKISDLAARRRAELLEWIIILLFVADILLLFLEKSGR